jgi:hypothetical protein
VVRDQVLKAAVLLTKDGRDFSPAAHGPFLTLLQDRLPAWIRRLEALADEPATSGVHQKLIEVAETAIAFFTEMQTAGLGAFTSIHSLVRVRRALHRHGLHYQIAVEPLARYLEGQRRAGHVTAAADPERTAELLLAGCFSSAFEELMRGPGDIPPRRTRAERLVSALRLEP